MNIGQAARRAAGSCEGAGSQLTRRTLAGPAEASAEPTRYPTCVSKTLYLAESRARKSYQCAACKRLIPPKSAYFRHEPHPYARMQRGEKATQWCVECIEASEPEYDRWSAHYRVPAVRVLDRSRPDDSREMLQPVRVELIGIAPILVQKLAGDPSLIHEITPEQFEEFICDRLFAMGFEPRQVSATYASDGGIDILFWSRNPATFPILGAVQVKHHSNPATKEGQRTIRDFAGAIAGQPFNAGIVVTNTSFSPRAEWFARQRATLVRLRGFQDIKRWLANNFADTEEWREIPDTIELSPGLTVKVRQPR